MNYEQFKSKIVDRAGVELDDYRSITIMPDLKYNGVIEERMVIKNHESNIFPSFKLKPLYEAYKQGMDFEEVLDSILTTYKKSKQNGFFDTQSLLQDYSMVSDKIIFKLINREKNKELLKEIPYIEYLDLAIIFFYNLPDLEINDGNSCMMVKNAHLNSWGVKVKDLMVDAMENTPRILGLKVRGIIETICDYLGDNPLKETFEKKEEKTPMYVATNKNGTSGASVILYQDMLKDLADKLKSDLYMIPCSVHEVILIEAIKGIDTDTSVLKDMIRQVNEEEIGEEDFLSDNLYWYSRSAEKLCIV